MGFVKSALFHHDFGSRLQNCTNKISHTTEFLDKQSAKLYFNRLALGGPSQATALDGISAIEDLLQTAQTLINDPKALKNVERDLFLAFAIDKVQSPEVCHSSNLYRENVARILSEYRKLPASAEDASTWAANCMRLISAPREGEGTLSKSTVRNRVGFFRRALDQVAAYSLIFGREKSSAAPGANLLVKNLIRNAVVAKSNDIEHYAPLSKTEIESLLNATETVQDKLWILKSLACGLRPTEVNKLQWEHIEGGKVKLERVITKTHTKKRPPASTVLKLILQLENRFDEPTYNLPEGFARYQFRTTAATHLVYCGVDHNGVADFLGHSTATMALKVYSTQRPPGAGDVPKLYYGISEVRVGGVSVAVDETLYHKWLLKLALETLMPLADAQTKRYIQNIVTPESAIDTTLQMVADF